MFIAITRLIAQNPFWTLPSEYAKFDPVNPSLPAISPLPTNNGSPSGYTHAGIMDPYGEIVFFTVDYYAYDKNGDEAGSYFDGPTYISGSSEALIVPQPGSCDRFYIFQGGIKEGFGDMPPYFSVFNQSLGYLEFDYGPAYTATNIERNLIENWDGGGLAPI